MQEVSSEDPYALSVFGVNWARGMQEGPAGAAASPYLLSAVTLKHFAVYSLEDYIDPASGHYYSRENSDWNVSAFDLADTCAFFPAEAINCGRPPPHTSL